MTRGRAVLGLTLAQLRERHVRRGQPIPREVENALREDGRAGAAAILHAVERRRQRNRAEGQRLRWLSRFEREAAELGYRCIAGVDEAGMSPLAGPVAAAAVVLDRGYRLVGIDDSKKLTAEHRDQLAAAIRRDAVGWAIGLVEPEEIDRINIYRAGLLAMRRAIEALPCTPDYLLIDARTLKELAVPQRNIVRGDAQSISIAAASILAKTRRDALMWQLDERYPGYGFAQHKGYPVKRHLDAIARLGASPVHRRSFGPVRQALGLEPQQETLFSMENTGVPH